MSFNINHVPTVTFGEGISQQTGDFLNRDGIKKVLCIYDKGLQSAGIVERIFKNVKKNDISLVVHDGILGEPSVETVDDVANQARREKVDAILGIGGGSAMDTAKCINVLLGNDGSIRDYFKMGVPRKPGKSLYLIPTTSGTGSEVTNVAVILNKEAGLKQGVMGSNCTAKLAIVDPELTLTLPSALTASTGMDAFSHAVESYTCLMNNPISDLLALEAISIITKYLPVAVKDGSDVHARTKMSYASTIAGMAFNSSPNHLGHAIAHAIGSIYHVPHGLGCGLSVPAVLEHLSSVIPDRIKAIGRAMGLRLSPKLDSNETGAVVANAVRKINNEIDLPCFSELGIEEDDLPNIAQEATRDGCWHFIPKETDEIDTLILIQKEYSI